MPPFDRARRPAFVAITILVALLGGMLSAAGCRPRAQSPAATPPRTLTVLAAASTADVMEMAAWEYEKRSGVKITLNTGASSGLAKQIIEGAQADLFLSADERWMDEVEKAARVKPETRRDLLSNRLVLIAPAGSALQITPAKGFELDRMIPAAARIALADPAHVPAGRYARESLEWLNWWQFVEPRMVPAADVRAALRLVELGEADLGIVYATDVRGSSKLRMLGSLPDESHSPIRYPIAVCEGASPDALAFAEFLRGRDMKKVFRGAGFGDPDE
jgi:molybdate transport system substrate-binding protein